MSQANADRNLLFGILALQMDFITRDQLVSAMQAWVFDKAQPLGKILLRQKALAEDTHALLEALVQKHLAQHNNDPEKSLAAVAVGSLKDELGRVADADLQASLVHVATARTEDADPFVTRVTAGDQAASSGSRFRILRPHARGGLGEVHVARDEELRREVAIKQIQERHADNKESQARFLLEAEITGGLEHPGIVPVYSLGQYADGRPFYAMRFIRGDSLKVAAERFHKADVPGRDPGERSLELRALLGRLVDVCNAIAYAHSRGVLHRDLKPGNVMLGKYGETLVVDWGLAKTLDAPEITSTEPGEGTLTPSSASLGGSATIMGSALGTPQFMSPEQAAGRLDLLGPASDVYSLGATLYSVLTGQAPFNDAETGTVLLKVQNGQFPPPRQVKADVPPALEAICMKAMALSPGDRYASPRALADDIEHWLADEPVSAWVEPWTVKARRWLGRHRTLVTGAVTAILVAALGLTVATILLTAANERERAARELAQRQEAEAKQQKEKAEHNFRLARQAVDRYHTEVSESVLLHEPGMEPLRAKLLDAAREFYEKFVSEHANEPGVQGELGKAYFRLAQITGDIDSETKAIELHQQAQRIFMALAEAEPQAEEWQSDLAKCWHHQGRLCRLTDQFAKAENAYRKALAIWEPLVDAHPRIDAYRADLARSQLGLGNVYQVTRRLDKAMDIYESALKMRAKLAKDHPDVPEYQRELAVSAGNLARVYSAMASDDQKAEKTFVDAISIQEKLVFDSPHISQYRNDVARSQFNLGDFYYQSGRRDEAGNTYQAAASLWQELVRGHPDVTAFQVNLAEAYMALAKKVFASSKNPGSAEDAAKKAMDIKKKLAKDHKDIVSFQEDLARGHVYMGDIYRGFGQFVKADAAYKEAVALLDRLARLRPDNSQVQADLARAYNSVGLLRADQKEVAKAEEAFRKALALWEKLGRAHPQELEFSMEERNTAYNLGNLLRDNGQGREALDWYAHAIRSLEKLGPDKDQPRIRLLLRDAHWKRAEAWAQLGSYAESLPDWDSALELAAATKQEAPIQLQRAVALARAGEFAKAVHEADLLTPKAAKSGAALYQLVHLYAFSMRAAALDGKLTSEARRGVSDQYALRALKLLEMARDTGFFQVAANLGRLKVDTELDPLRQRADFREFVSETEQKSKPAP